MTHRSGLGRSLLLSVLVLGCASPAASEGPAGTVGPGATSAPPASPAATAPVSTPAPIATPAPSTTAGEPVRIALSGATPDAIALDGTTAWVLAGEGGSLMEIDLGSRREVSATDVGFGATHVVLPRPGVAAVARFDNSGNGAYCVLVDLASRAVKPVASGALGALTAGDVGVAWALEQADRLLKIDATEAKVVDSAAVEVGENVHVEVRWGAGSAWVGSDGLPVVRISGKDLRVEKTIPVATGIPFLFEGGMLWGAGPTELWAIDPATNAITRHVPLVDLIEVLALDIDGDDAWIAARRPGYVGTVLRLDLTTGDGVAEYPVSLPSAVKIGPDRVWVASYETNELLGFAR